MSESLTQLEGWLQEAVLGSALSLSEAWLIQDQLLLSTQEWATLPPELAPLAERLSLFEMSPPEGRPLH
jgi:hypothetical protein